jgi:glycosyltransferase involved in cell wall biosynthesis
MYEIFNELEKQKQLEVRMSKYDPKVPYFNLPNFETLIENPQTIKKISNELDILDKVEKVDIWVFQKFQTCWGLALIDLINRVYKRPVIMEIDDYMFGLAGDHPCAEQFDPESENGRVGRSQLQISQAVIVSTEYLKKLYDTENLHIFVIPNSIDFNLWDKLVNNIHKSYINIGWSGGSGHDRDLKVIIPVIKEIIKKYKNVRFTLTGDPLVVAKEFGNNKQVRCSAGWVQPIDFPEYSAKLGVDIALAPLVDSNFNRAKSNIRWLQASALKIPVVASDVGPYKDTNALKCSSTEEWVLALESLIQDPLKRKQMGQDGYDRVKKEFNLAAIAKQYQKILEEVHNGWQNGLKK